MLRSRRTDLRRTPRSPTVPRMVLSEELEVVVESAASPVTTAVTAALRAAASAAAPPSSSDAPLGAETRSRRPEL
eukprot:6145473-Prymnesium_polylepis.1